MTEHDKDTSFLSDQQWILLDRYAAGELSAEEHALLEQHATQSRALRQMMQSMRQVGHRWDKKSWDLAEGWKAVTLRNAARRTRPAARLVSPEVDRPAPVSSRADRQKHRWLFRIGGLALAGVAVAAALWIATTEDRAGTPDPAAMREFATVASQRTSLQLADGTRVTLAPQSTLRIPENFGKVRDVYLQGEALFAVASSAATPASSPFIVHTHHADVRVLGTTFNVRAYDDLDRAEVTVVDGTVSLASPRTAAPATIVTANHFGVVYPNGETRVEPADTERHTAWINNRLIYNKAPLREALADISRWYDVQVVLNRIPTERRQLTAEWSTQSLNDVLRSLSLVLDARSEYRNGQVLLSPREEAR